jgi:hypothetical protein
MAPLKALMLAGLAVQCLSVGAGVNHANELLSVKERGVVNISKHLNEKIRRPRQAEGGDPLDWLRASVPGEPGQDYPVLSAIQETSFSCSGRVMGGYYADPEQGCQAYHVCLQSDPELNLYPVSFLCPNGTVFNQAVFVCDWWFNVDCSASERLYAGVEGAFAGVLGDGQGACPAPSLTTCPGAPPSNCWSPGRTDTDCPNNGLCCFDGCADRCLEGPSQEPEGASAQILPVEEPSEPKGYSYPVPDEPLLLPKPRPPPPGLPTLYGAPPI